MNKLLRSIKKNNNSFAPNIFQPTSANFFSNSIGIQINAVGCCWKVFFLTIVRKMVLDKKNVPFFTPNLEFLTPLWYVAFSYSRNLELLHPSAACSWYVWWWWLGRGVFDKKKRIWNGLTKTKFTLFQTRQWLSSVTVIRNQ